MPKHEFDLIVIGSGPAGEKAAIEAAKLRKSTAIIERHSVQGGVCIHTGTIPSKTLRETVLYYSGLRKQSAYGAKMLGLSADMTVAQLMHRKDQVVQQEVDVIRQTMARHRIEVIHGTGMIADPHTVVVSKGDSDTRIIHGDKIIIATGTHPHHPDNIVFDHRYIYDAETITQLDIIPNTLTIIGGGVIGCEYAGIFAQLGVGITIVDSRDRLLSFLDREIGDALMYLMRKYRIRLVLNDQPKVVFEQDGEVHTITSTGRRIIADRLLYAAGRSGNTDNLGLEPLGIETNKYGLVPVNENFQTSVPNIYAVGDVIGFPSLASVSMDQGRLASLHAFCGSNHGEINALLPIGIYTIPEVSMVGETEESLNEAGREYEVGIARYFELARGQIKNDHDGMLKMIFDPQTRKILGVHVVGERATELVHTGQAVMSLGGTIDYFANTVLNYPTLSEAYKVAALDGLSRIYTRDEESACPTSASQLGAPSAETVSC